MKRVGRRAQALLLIVLAVLVGLSLYIIRLMTDGRNWASHPSNKTVYTNGILMPGTVLDRNGVVLSSSSGGRRTYAADQWTRTATLHAVGDPEGNIGTGALSQFASRLMGYNFFTGAYSRTGEGKKLYLSIDTGLNVTAYKALNGKKGAVGVMNYKTGEILCMVSAPSYDPDNKPDFDKNPDKYEGVYINRFLSSVYTPGSTFKLVTLAAAVENIPDLYDRPFRCTGRLNVGGESVTDTDKHGEIGIEDALAVSCNTAFGELSLELGGDTLKAYADRLGLTSPIVIDGIATAKGNFDVAEDGTANLAWSGIGQYNDTVCPAGMLRFMSAVANGGVAARMTLFRETGLDAILPKASHRLLSKDTAEKIAVMMNYNVYKTYGQKNFPGLELYAKSGTAEVGGGKAPNAWFVGFIKNEDYPLAFVVVVENGGYGAHTAGAVANSVLQAAVKDNVTK